MNGRMDSPQGMGFLFWFFAIGTTVFSIGLGLLSFFAIPEFAAVYRDFGAELPLPTALVIRSRHGFWLLTGVAMVIWWLFHRSPERLRLRMHFLGAFLFLGMIGVCLLVVAAVALYLPLVKLC